MVRHLEEITRMAGRPYNLNTHQVRGLMREWRRFTERMSVIRRAPHTLNSCAACTPHMSVVCFDGIFKLWRYSRSYASWREPVIGKPGSAGALFADPAVVAPLLKALEGAEAAIKGDVCGTCGTSEIAALRSKSQGGKHLMDVTGCYMSCCGHSMLLKAFDFHGGERHSFAVAMYLLLPGESDVICGDTMCQIGRRFERLQNLHNDGKLELPPGVSWKSISACAYAVNAMHVQGVCSTCQLSSSRPL